MLCRLSLLSHSPPRGKTSAWAFFHETYTSPKEKTVISGAQRGAYPARPSGDMPPEPRRVEGAREAATTDKEAPLEALKTLGGWSPGVRWKGAGKGTESLEAATTGSHRKNLFICQVLGDGKLESNNTSGVQSLC